MHCSLRHHDFVHRLRVAILSCSLILLGTRCSTHDERSVSGYGAPQDVIVERPSAVPAMAEAPAKGDEYELDVSAIRRALDGRGISLNNERWTTLRAALDNCSAHPTTGSTSSIWEFLSSALVETGLRSEVSFRTRVPGAVIRYRLITRTDAETASRPTNETVESLPIGLYFIWTERDGRPTFETRRRYRVIEEKRTIEIPEAE